MPSSSPLSENLILTIHKINLISGVPRGEIPETCLYPLNLLQIHLLIHCRVGTAGAGSLIIEFATLSRLTGDNRFEKAASKAFFALWNRRSDIGLVGNTININTGVRHSRIKMCGPRHSLILCHSPGQHLKSVVLALGLTLFMS
jgi:hypothetical protein